MSIAAAAQDRIDPTSNTRPQYRTRRETGRAGSKDLSRIKFKLDSVTGIVERARDKLDEIRLLLVDMRKAVELSQSSTATDDEKRTQANVFDQKLGLINIKVRNFGTIGNNLLGSQFRDVFDADTISFPIRPNSLQEDSITGLFAGSDFTITQNGTGDVFVPDIFGAKVQSLPISVNEDVDDGIQLLDDDTVTLDNGTGAVSITRNGEATPVLEGNLERKGLDVLFSPFYGNFLNDTSLQEALEDVDSATQTIRFITVSSMDSLVGSARGGIRLPVASRRMKNSHSVWRLRTCGLSYWSRRNSNAMRSCSRVLSIQRFHFQIAGFSQKRLTICSTCRSSSASVVSAIRG